MTDIIPSQSRRDFLRFGAACALSAPFVHVASLAASQDMQFSAILDEAESLESLETIIIARDGEILAERGYRGHTLSDPTNIKSASKSVMSALVGIAIGRGVLEGVDQRIAPLLRDDIPAAADARVEEITVGHLLSMQAGLRPTSGADYGRWVSGPNWVRGVLVQPFEDDPGGRMLYSTGSTHLLSAILTETTGRSTFDNAQEWLGVVDGFSIAGWQRDPQGVFLGGNEMAMSPRSLLAFGEVWRRDGTGPDGTQVLPRSWVDQAWTPRTTSRWSGDGYGYGWFLRTIAGEDTRFAWGYGGQMLYIVPALGLTIVMTSDDTPRPTTIADRDALHALSAVVVERLRAQ
jgi:CubicO group peptidase (beta-lactamase class C family)